jgi:hypothetical protein
MGEMERIDIYRAAIETLSSGAHEADLYEGYSGRGMYGKEVPAIVTDAPATLVGWAICSAVADNGDHETPADAMDAAEKLIPKRTDNMGKSYVYY